MLVCVIIPHNLWHASVKKHKNRIKKNIYKQSVHLSQEHQKNINNPSHCSKTDFDNVTEYIHRLAECSKGN